MADLTNDEPLLLPTDKRRLADLETRVDRQRNVGLVVLILLTVANIIGLVGNGVLLNAVFDNADEVKELSEENKRLNQQSDQRAAANAVLVSEIVEVVNDINRVVREHAGLPPGPQVTTPISVPTTTTTVVKEQSKRSNSPNPNSTSHATSGSPNSPTNPETTTTTIFVSPICTTLPIEGIC